MQKQNEVNLTRQQKQEVRSERSNYQDYFWACCKVRSCLRLIVIWLQFNVMVWSFILLLLVLFCIFSPLAFLVDHFWVLFLPFACVWILACAPGLVCLFLHWYSGFDLCLPQHPVNLSSFHINKHHYTLSALCLCLHLVPPPL